MQIRHRQTLLHQVVRFGFHGAVEGPFFQPARTAAAFQYRGRRGENVEPAVAQFGGGPQKGLVEKPVALEEYAGGEILAADDLKHSQCSRLRAHRKTICSFPNGFSLFAVHAENVCMGEPVVKIFHRFKLKELATVPVEISLQEQPRHTCLSAGRRPADAYDPKHGRGPTLERFSIFGYAPILPSALNISKAAPSCNKQR